MATNLSTHNPIAMWETISGNTEFTQNPPEAASQTFLAGTPVELASGFCQAWDGTTITAGIYGVSLDYGHNLTTAGAGYPANFGQQGPPWATLTEPAPPNQPSAPVIPYGAPFVTGGTLTMVANQDTVFRAQYDTAEGTTTITAASVTSNVVSATATNTHFVGEEIIFSGFTGAGAPLNGLKAIVATASGSAYTANLETSIANIATAGAGSDNPTYAPTAQMVGKQFGLTKDANGSWYIDGAKVTSGTNTVLVVTGLYQADVLQSTPFVEVPNGQLLFQFLPAAQQV